MRACHFEKPWKSGIALCGSWPRSSVSASHSVTIFTREQIAGVKITSVSQAKESVIAGEVPELGLLIQARQPEHTEAEDQRDGGGGDRPRHVEQRRLHALELAAGLASEAVEVREEVDGVVDRDTEHDARPPAPWSHSA